VDQRETLHLVSALADRSRRAEAARNLVARVGGTALYVLVPDRKGRFIAAPGFTRPPDDESAVTYTCKEIAFVITGEHERDEALASTLETIAPLVAAVFAREATLVQVRTEAEQASRVKDELLAMIGHELRNPLAPIVTALQMLELDGKHERIHDVLRRHVAHLVVLVEDLLDVSRLTRGAIELRRSAIEIHDVVTRALEMTRPMLESKQNNVVVDVPTTGLVVHGDLARLAQVIANLVTNASKYSESCAKIELTAKRDADLVRISVSDEGVGLAASMLERVFEQFVQVPQGSDRATGGLGLGLAIVRSLVHLHGGRVQAFSEGSGRGSTFTVELPACDGAPADLSSCGEVVTASASVDTPVLIVDDNRDAAELLGQILESFGYAVRLAHDGPEALQLAPAFRPAVALLDIGLPVMDGYELARKLRSRLPDIRLVAVTGYGQPNDRRRALDAGFQAHLIKPVTIGTVTETLDKLLHG
jgi:signal transduction histidine kinase